MPNPSERLVSLSCLGGKRDFVWTGMLSVCLSLGSSSRREAGALCLSRQMANQSELHTKLCLKLVQPQNRGNGCWGCRRPGRGERWPWGAAGPEGAAGPLGCGCTRTPGRTEQLRCSQNLVPLWLGRGDTAAPFTGSEGLGAGPV